MFSGVLCTPEGVPYQADEIWRGIHTKVVHTYNYLVCRAAHQIIISVNDFSVDSTPYFICMGITAEC